MNEHLDKALKLLEMELADIDRLRMLVSNLRAAGQRAVKEGKAALKRHEQMVENAHGIVAFALGRAMAAKDKYWTNRCNKWLEEKMNEQDHRLIGGGYWDDDPEFPVKDWQYEVANGDTRQSFREWIESKRAQKEQDDFDRHAEQRDHEPSGS